MDTIFFYQNINGSNNLFVHKVPISAIARDFPFHPPTISTWQSFSNVAVCPQRFSFY